jgi:hypothetical protein
MDEINRLPLSGFTPDSDVTRATYDSIADYNGYTDGPNNLTDLAGNAYPIVYQPFSRSVSMTTVTMSPAGWNRTLSGLLITVTISENGASVITLQRIAWQ